MLITSRKHPAQNFHFSFLVLFNDFNIHLKIMKTKLQIFSSSLVLLHIGTSLSQNKDPGGLLLLRVRASRTSWGPCALLCWNGAQHDQNYQVMPFFPPSSSCFIVSDCVLNFLSQNAITRQVIPTVVQRPRDYCCEKGRIFSIHVMHGNR